MFFTGASAGELEIAHSSVAVQNRTHVNMNVFLSQRLGISSTRVMSTTHATPRIIAEYWTVSRVQNGKAVAFGAQKFETVKWNRITN